MGTCLVRFILGQAMFLSLIWDKLFCSPPLHIQMSKPTVAHVLLVKSALTAHSFINTLISNVPCRPQSSGQVTERAPPTVRRTEKAQ